MSQTRHQRKKRIDNFREKKCHCHLSIVRALLPTIHEAGPYLCRWAFFRIQGLQFKSERDPNLLATSCTHASRNQGRTDRNACHRRTLEPYIKAFFMLDGQCCVHAKVHAWAIVDPLVFWRNDSSTRETGKQRHTWLWSSSLDPRSAEQPRQGGFLQS